LLHNTFPSVGNRFEPKDSYTKFTILTAKVSVFILGEQLVADRLSGGDRGSALSTIDERLTTKTTKNTKRD